MPRYYNTGVTRPDSVLTTAEDGLLKPAEMSRGQSLLELLQYSGDPSR
ncbi:MAG TPA: hypothetical protein VGV35_08310 [Bryobacteraceae bacterium]|nr:hypothetical protein [Bryobacteraceae bacterium]